MVTVMQQTPAAETTAPDQTTPGLDGLTLVTAKVAGEVLGLSPYYVGLLVESGELASTKVGKTLFIPATSIRDYVTRVAATAKAAGQ
jgi:outer membrane protein W